MMSSFTRRNFLIGGGAMAALAGASQADAGLWASVAAFMITGDILSAVAGLFDYASDYDSSKRLDATIKTISSQLVSVASRQEAINLELRNISSIVWEASRAGTQSALADDHVRQASYQLQGFAQNFNVALAGDGSYRAGSLLKLAGDIGNSIFSMGGNGLNGTPTYISAIALQNAVHKALRSTPGQFEQFNPNHKQTLQVLLNGDAPDAFPAISRKIVNPYPSAPPDSPVFNFGERFVIWQLMTVYDGGITLQNQEAYYRGFYKGAPLFGNDPLGAPFVPEGTAYWQSNADASSTPLRGYVVLPLVYQTSTTVAGKLVPKYYNLDPTYTAAQLSRNAPVIDGDKNPISSSDGTLSLIKNARNAVVRYYQDLYSPDMGTAFNPDGSAQQWATMSNMKTLLNTSISNVDYMILQERKLLRA